MGSCPQATPQHTGEEEEEEEGPAPAAVGLGARLCRSPAASYPKQPLKKKAGQELEGPPQAERGPEPLSPLPLPPWGPATAAGTRSHLGTAGTQGQSQQGAALSLPVPRAGARPKGLWPT